MMQTKIDQFFKVVNSNKNIKSVNVKNSREKSSSFGSPEKTELFSKNLRTNPAYGTSKTSSKKISKKQMKSHLWKNDKKNSPTKAMNAKAAISPITKQTSPNRNHQFTVYSNSKYIPKTPSPIKISLDNSQKSKNIARRKLFMDRTDELIYKAIDNLNLAKEGAITNNNINLEKVYSSGIFNYKYNSIDTTATTKYEIDDVVIPSDTYSLHFFLVIGTVFSKPANCGYFDKDELDLIFSLVILSKDAQALLIRMLKRKQTWHRISSIKYDEISNDLKPIFNELVSRSIFKSNTEEEDISVLLNLLQADEIRKLCQQFKISNGNKQNCIQSILKFCNKTKSLFAGIQSPATRLRISVNRILGCCILFNTRLRQIIDKIITLLMPNRDPTETLADVFLTILKVETNQIKFPEVHISDFPIFASKKHLLDYIEAKNALSDVLNAIEKKQWQVVRDFGSSAAQHFSYLLDIETYSLQDSTLPNHIRHFMPGYVWLKVLSKSIDAFKKTVETMPQAIEFLHMLIDQNCHMKNKKGQWYNELIKIEMHHRKDFDTSVILLSNATSQVNLTEIDKLDLLEKAERLANRKSRISQYAKDTVKLILDKKLSEARPIGTDCVTIEGTLCKNDLQRKSTWCISTGIDQIYGTVESLALYNYKYKGYPKGVHCEGAFPITLFGTLFWHEIYNINIPGAYVSLYQDAPLDLFSSDFYENRKEQIDMKLQMFRKFDSKTLSTYLKHEYDLHCEFQSICQDNIFNDSSSLEEIAFCLGVGGVVGICERLIDNFVLWRAGFPDLIVWNADTKQYKIVEVKGPGDSLSTKQKFWLKYLNQLGLNTEVCYCESNMKSRSKRKYEAVI